MSNVALDTTKKHELNRFRPPSAPNGFKVKKWKPIYDKIVSGHIIGKSNIELAAEYDFTPVHICNILRSDQAQILIAEASERLRGAALANIDKSGEIQTEIQELALDKIKQFAANDELFRNNPFGVFDRLVKLANPNPPLAQQSEKVTVTVNNNQVSQTNNNEIINIRTESMDRLSRALEITRAEVIESKNG